MHLVASSINLIEKTKKYLRQQIVYHFLRTQCRT